MSAESNQTILLDIYQRLGTIEEQLRSVTKNHDAMEIQVAILQSFQARVAAYIWLGGSIASGVLFFLFEGLKYVFDKWTH